MNLLLLERHELGPGGQAILRGRRAAHLLGVLGVRPGATVRVGVERGALGTATVTTICAETVTLDVTLQAHVEPSPTVDLVLALPRPKALSRTLQAAATLGVGRIDLVNMWRVHKSYFSSPRLRPESIREALLLGCEQGATTWVPDVNVHRLFVPFLMETLLPRLQDDTTTYRVVAHPRASTFLEQAITVPAPGRAVAAIGPEGGFIDQELASFQRLGFVPVQLSRGILRVEAAVVALLAELALLQRWAPAREPYTRPSERRAAAGRPPERAAGPGQR